MTDVSSSIVIKVDIFLSPMLMKGLPKPFFFDGKLKTLHFSGGNFSSKQCVQSYILSIFFSSSSLSSPDEISFQIFKLPSNRYNPFS